MQPETPDRDNLLSSLSREYVLLPGTATLLDALRELQARDGGDAWYLVVELGGGGWLAASFGDLGRAVASRGPQPVEANVQDLGFPLVAVDAVDMNAPLPEARELAQASASRSISMPSTTIRSEARA